MDEAAVTPKADRGRHGTQREMKGLPDLGRRTTARKDGGGKEAD